MAIDDQGGVEVAGRQRQQVRLLAGMTLARRFLEVAQDTDIGDLGQPPRGHLVEMLQRVEGAAVEQAGFDVEELAFDFALGLRPANAARLRAEAVVRGEGEELGVVQRAVGVVPEHHRFEVVVQADAGDAAQVMEGMHVLAQGRQQVHRLDPAQVLPPRVAEQVAEQVDAPAAFAREVEVVDAIVHLGLLAWPGLKARHGRRRRRGRSSRMRCRTTV